MTINIDTMERKLVAISPCILQQINYDYKLLTWMPIFTLYFNRFPLHSEHEPKNINYLKQYIVLVFLVSHIH